MADLHSKFDQAIVDSKSLPEKPDNMTLLKLYAFYKQATEGDASGGRPGFTNPVGRAKYDAWASMQGMSHEDAKAEYVDLARRQPSRHRPLPRPVDQPVLDHDIIGAIAERDRDHAHPRLPPHWPR